MHSTAQPTAFAARLTRLPIPHEAEAAKDVALVFADIPAPLRDLLAATAGCSPFLRDLMRREADWLREAMTEAPEVRLSLELATLDGLGAEPLAPALRRTKRRVALLTALADLGGVWSLEQVTTALTILADRAVSLGISAFVAEEIRRGKLPGTVESDAATGAGMVALAMGKMGAGELNYSSDIDLICLFDEARYPGEDQEARTAFIRVTRKLTALLSDQTGDGYVFRTDLRLRPDAAVTPVCLSMAAAEAYYEAQGRTWERAAYIKARPCGGDLAAGERFLKTLTPFVWRKHLDYAAIQDAHDMRLRIRDHRHLHGPLQLEGHNMKLGQGGIREIEFFTQTRQLIAGGRDPDLRDRTTVGGLAALAAKGWVPPDVTDELTQTYRDWREIEHRLQMVNDAQTQTLPPTADGIARIAHFLGQSDVDAFRRNLLDRLERVERLTGGFFAPSEAAEGPDLSDHARSIVANWSRYPALRSDRASAIFRRLRPSLLKSLSRASNPDEALLALDGFLAGLPAGVQLFSLFEANPVLVDLIVDICSTSPALASYLSRNSGVLDGVIGGSFFAPWPGTAALTQMLAAQLDDAADYERRLDAARRWMKEWHFRIGVHHLRGLIDAFEAGKSYAELAEAVVAALYPHVEAEVAARHGPPPGEGATVLAMGSLGAGQLNAGSDLDLIVIYDPAGQDISEGRRPLPSRTWYARLTQALVTALTAPMAEGRLFEVDMRLRPSGRQGPVATSFDAFCAYQQDEAWTWEHLALTRARAIAGNRALGDRIETFRRDLLAAKGRGEKVLTDVAEMRARLRSAKPAGGDWEAKNGPGRLMDIELLAQTAALHAGSPQRRVEAQLRAGVKAGFLTAADEARLLTTYRLCWRVQSASRLIADEALPPETWGEGGRAFLLRETDMQTVASLTAALVEATDDAASIIDARLGVGGDVAAQGGETHNEETGDAGA
ncbi:glutamine-synthetase adenylyltransferase [Tabrizicola sp. J26]|uniref:[protein-PII] uridylyltransferase family protein n=1 Tax=Alitabrizicola rongguiensis TaxID=2909234 RepID=UPI001F1CAE13|nr:glutamine-synthetase adenylyltransferase [Tabrizicola rongguiensis]MCF1710089.1 glutamine-synthetase adenylyltransferase [Tabrizicola rongguiensis]